MLRSTRVVIVALILATLVPVLQGQTGNRQSSYYGIPIAESAVVFLLDVSGSMEDKNEGRTASIWRKGAEIAAERLGRTQAGETTLGQAAIDRLLSETTKLGAARRELFNALRSLSAVTEFTIITFGQEVEEWPRGMQKSRGEALKHAQAHVLLLRADGGTPMAEAVRLAFGKPRVRTIFLVSDGKPTTGDVRTLIRELQDSRGPEKVVINTIGIGKDQDKQLLCNLAKDNYGVFVSDGVLACTSNPCPDRPDMRTYFRPTNPFRHQFREPVTEMCNTRQRGCTPQFVFETMTQRTSFGAPTFNKDPVHNCQDFTLRVRAFLPDPITIVLDSENLTWINYTRQGHIFHPGRIVRRVFRKGNSVFVETIGEGVGDWPRTNEAFAPHLFEEVDERLKEEVTRRLSNQ